MAALESKAAIVLYHLFNANFNYLAFFPKLTAYAAPLPANLLVLPLL